MFLFVWLVVLNAGGEIMAPEFNHKDQMLKKSLVLKVIPPFYRI